MFDEMLIRAKEEVRDLRTAHPRGLGMLDFATASATASGTSPLYGYIVVVTFADSGVFPPFLQLSSYQANGTFFKGSWDAENLTFTVDYYQDYNDESSIPTIKAVASVPIESITVTPRAENE